MKKLVLMLAVVFSVSLFSCGNGDDKKAADTVDSTAAPVEAVEETVVTETVVADSAAAPADSAAATTAPAAEVK